MRPAPHYNLPPLHWQVLALRAPRLPPFHRPHVRCVRSERSAKEGAKAPTHARERSERKRRCRTNARANERSERKRRCCSTDARANERSERKRRCCSTDARARAK
jgi:hypothetical protein